MIRHGLLVGLDDLSVHSNLDEHSNPSQAES